MGKDFICNNADHGFGSAIFNPELIAKLWRGVNFSMAVNPQSFVNKWDHKD